MRQTKADTTKLIGHLADGDYSRDAIHVAVIPVEAAQGLVPGQHISLRNGKASADGSHIGIVDPFLRSPVEAGQKFWLCLYPGTITSLNHVWTHPAFADVPQDPNEFISYKAASEKWLREYAERVNSYDAPETAYQRLLQDLSSGEITYQGTDMHGRQDLQDEKELKFHAEIVLGTAIDFDKFEFSCSC